MTRARVDDGGTLVVDSTRYRLRVAPGGLLATLSTPEGEHLASLRLLAALDCLEGPDETLSVDPPRLFDAASPVIALERRSTRWKRATLSVACHENAIELRAAVAGRGRLADVHLLGGRSLIPGGHTGFLPSGSSFRTLFSPNPGDPRRLVRSAAEAIVIGVAGDAEPGRGNWFFTPAPLWLALTRAEGLVDPAETVAEGWLGVGMAAPVAELTFAELAYQPADGAFSLRLDYGGHTAVDGAFQTPTVVLTPAVPDPYTGLRLHRDDLVARGASPAPRQRARPGWWSEPIFCGWGAQCHLAAEAGRPAPELSTQANYDAFLGHLEHRGVVPGTVIVDDKWQTAYGTCEPDRVKWPDLARWVAERRARGQRVLLWWKAWDPEGLAPETCILNPDGVPIALDPGSASARDALRRAIAQMIGADGIDADGLKIDFTGASPSGTALTRSGSGWGIALLHELLALVYAETKRLKPEALVITHTPHPSFTDVTDMVRLNDMLRLDDPDPLAPVVPQMRYRAATVRAACPELLIDTDDWCVPDRAAWREYLEVKPELGIPSLYYATHLDLSGEPLEPSDYAALRRTWRAWREARSPR